MVKGGRSILKNGVSSRNGRKEKARVGRFKRREKIEKGNFSLALLAEDHLGMGTGGKGKLRRKWGPSCRAKFSPIWKRYRRKNKTL